MAYVFCHYHTPLHPFLSRLSILSPIILSIFTHTCAYPAYYARAHLLYLISVRTANTQGLLNTPPPDTQLLSVNWATACSCLRSAFSSPLLSPSLAFALPIPAHHPLSVPIPRAALFSPFSLPTPFYQDVLFHYLMVMSLMLFVSFVPASLIILFSMSHVLCCVPLPCRTELPA